MRLTLKPSPSSRTCQVPQGRSSLSPITPPTLGERRPWRRETTGSAPAEARQRGSYVGEVDERRDRERQVDDHDVEQDELHHHRGAQEDRPTLLGPLAGGVVVLRGERQRADEGEQLDRQQDEV